MFLLIVQIVEHKADLLMLVLIVLEFWSLSQGHRLTGDVKCVQVLNKKVWLEKKNSWYAFYICSGEIDYFPYWKKINFT